MVALASSEPLRHRLAGASQNFPPTQAVQTSPWSSSW